MAKFICICYGQWRILRSKFKEDKMASSEMEKKKGTCQKNRCLR